MGLKTIVPVTGEVSTSDANWTNVATCTINANCSILISNIFVIGRATDGTVGETANATAVHRAKRVSAVLTLVGQIVFILTLNTGSDSAMVACDMQMLVSGNTLQLQVKGYGTRAIDWYGGFTVIQN